MDTNIQKKTSAMVDMVVAQTKVAWEKAKKWGTRETEQVTRDSCRTGLQPVSVATGLEPVMTGCNWDIVDKCIVLRGTNVHTMCLYRARTDENE